MGFPAKATDPGGFYAGFSVETLIEATQTPLKYSPLLATSWDLAPDKTSYTFHLRKGVKFHDGTDFNAAAVKWNLENVIAAKRVELAPVSSVDVVDDYTVKVNLKSWTSLVLDAYCRNLTGMISPTAYQKNGEDWCNLHPIGTGPFIFKDYQNAQYVKYAKNPNYWDKNLPYLDAIEVYTIKDPMTLQAMLLNAEAEGARELDGTSAKTLVDSGKFFAELGAQGNYLLGFNTTDPKSVWTDKNMRMALEYALDKQTMSDSLGKGFTHPSYEIISGIFETQGNNPGTTPRKYDLAKAKQLLKDAGYEKGLNTQIELNSKFQNDFLVATQGQLAKVGINLEINSIPQAVWAEKSLQPPLPNVLRYNRGRGGPFDMLRMTNEDLASTSIKYPGTKRPDGWDALLAQCLQETDPNKILTIMNQMEQKAYADVFFVPIYIEQNINVWSPKVKNDLGPVMYWGGVDSSQSVRFLYLQK